MAPRLENFNLEAMFFSVCTAKSGILLQDMPVIGRFFKS